MARNPQAASEKRPPRVRVAGTVLALLRLENGRQVRARLHQISTTGGLLHLQSPVEESIKVEVLFHIGEHTVRSKARTLFPMWATQGCLQPFQFQDLPPEEEQKLDSTLQSFFDRSTPSAVVKEVTFDPCDSDAPAGTVTA